MTNLQANSTRLSPQKLRLLWFGLPAAAISLLTLLLGAAVLVPLWSALQADSKRLGDLQDLQGQVGLMRLQLVSQDKLEARSLAQKDRLINLIIGSGDVSTFLAMLDREAKVAGVQLDLYQPQAAAAVPRPLAPGSPTAAPAPGSPAATEAQPDPLEAEGLQRNGMQILAKGPYPQLLKLLERLESLSVLVEQSGLKLDLKDPVSTDLKRPAPVPPVTMTIGFSLYGRPPGSRSRRALASPGGLPPARSSRPTPEL